MVEQNAGYNLVEGKEGKGKERDDNDCGGGDLESQLFIYMTQPRRCAPQAVPHSSASGSEQLCNYGHAPVGVAMGCRPPGWDTPRLQQPGAELKLPANVLAFGVISRAS